MKDNDVKAWTGKPYRVIVLCDNEKTGKALALPVFLPMQEVSIARRSGASSVFFYIYR